MSRTNTLQIRTPEGVVFSQPLAGPMLRFLAWLIDFFIVWMILMALGMVMTFFSLVAGEFVAAINVLLFFLLNVGYGIALEWKLRGQTFGKRVMRLRVVDAQGLRLKFNQIVIRNLLRTVDMLPVAYLLGGIACVASRRSQRLGDFAANTVVLRIPTLTTPDVDPLVAGKFNSFREYPHLEARLRQRVTAPEAALALQAVVRRDRLDAAARLELFREMAAHFREKVTFPSEATESMTDEQYVRNVLDTLYRKQIAAAAVKAGAAVDRA